MNSQVYLQRLRHALAHCDELESTILEIQNKLECRRGQLAETMLQLQLKLEKKEADEVSDKVG